MQEQQYDIDLHSNMIQKRDQDVAEIEETMVQINEIYKDLSVLVSDQGQVLDNIESNIAMADGDVHTGLLSLEKSSKYQRSSRRWMCIVLVILMIIIVILIAVLVPKK